MFQSPIVDMKWFVRHMMLWSGVSEKQLEEKQEITTEIDTLRWDYYQYILSHPLKNLKVIHTFNRQRTVGLVFVP